MNTKRRSMILASLLFPCVTLSMCRPAFGAKGIKNTPVPNTSRVWTGKIVGIDIPNQVFRLESIQANRSTVLVNGVSVPRMTKQKIYTNLAVTPSTVVHRQDGLLLPQAALQIGTHLRAQSIGNTASAVTVYVPHRRVGYTGYTSRHRPRAYYPQHYYHQHATHFHHNHHRRK